MACAPQGSAKHPTPGLTWLVPPSGKTHRTRRWLTPKAKSRIGTGVRWQVTTLPRWPGDRNATPEGALESWIRKHGGKLAPGAGAALVDAYAQAGTDTAAHTAPPAAAAGAPVPDATAGALGWSAHVGLLDCIDLEEAVLNPIPVFRFIPNTHRAACRQILREVLEALALTAPQTSGTPTTAQLRLEKLWVLLPRFLWARRRAKGPEGCAIRQVGENLHRFSTGDWLETIALATDPPLGARSTETDDATAATGRRANRAVTAATYGNLARAAAALDAAELAPPSQLTVDALTAALGSDHSAADLPPAPLWERIAPTRADICEATTAKYLRATKKGGAHDLAGWTYEHLQAMLACKDTFAAIVDTLHFVANGVLSTSCIAALATARLTPLRKGTGPKVRPLACGMLWRRLTMAVIVAQNKELLTLAGGDSQFGVGRPAALEKMSERLRQLLAATPDPVLIQLDAAGAFNNLHRTAALEAVYEAAPQVAKAAGVWLRKPTRVVYLMPDGTHRSWMLSRGLDQGCPASPALFAAAMRQTIDLMESWLAACDAPLPGLRAGAGGVAAYLDDLTLVVPRYRASEALDVAEASCAVVGLSLNVDKTSIWPVYGGAPDTGRAGTIWAAGPKNDGVVLCGAPVARPPGERDDCMQDWAHATPLGDDPFSAQYLAQHETRLLAYLHKIAAVPTECGNGRPGAQTALALLRHCGGSRVAHLLRLVNPDTVANFARATDEHLHATLATILGLPPLTATQRRMASLPLAMGGMGIGGLHAIRECAHIGGWCAAASKPAPGERTRVPDTVTKAAAHLTDHRGVPVAKLLGGLLGEDATCGRSKAQKTLASALQEHEYLNLVADLPPKERATLESGSTMPGADGKRSPTATAWLEALPRTPGTTLSDAVITMACKLRLGSPVAAPFATCSYIASTALRACGRELTGDASHAHGCCKGPATWRHHAIRDLLLAKTREAGRWADREQVVHELGPLVRPGKPPKMRIADVRSTKPAGAGTTYFDVVISCPHHVWAGQPVSDKCGEAATRAANRKCADYRPGPAGREVHFIPVAAETGGRWEHRFERELVCLARERVLKTSDDACTEGGHSAAVSAVLQRWRQEFSCALMKGCWAVLAASLGATPLDHCRLRPAGLELADHW